MSNLKRVDFVNKTVLPEEKGGHMADLSNGYTKVANEIQQLKPRLRMSGREWQCFEAVIWLTYGWNKKQDRVTNTVIAELTGLSDTHVSDAIKALAERKIIFSQKQGMMKLVGVNTELSGWILDKPETGRKFPKTGKSLPKSGKSFPKTVATQYKNKNSNKTSTSENSDESSDSHGKKLPVLKPDAAIQSGAKWGTSEDLRCAEWLFAVVQSISSSAKQPNYAAWANDIRLMRERDNRTHKEIAALFRWACDDDFWKGNVLCPSTLREKWTQLDIKRNKQLAGKAERIGNKPDLDFNNTDWAYGVIG
ncbi:replication protein [Salmonella enterica]|nr:replication protein [Salmonella enterica]EJA6080996.1 replication protein [Salmonella enterica]EJA6164021.1 replication protein [Salmonella enterica]EJA6182364.1 replication protein [Salmonella enterica]EKT2969186.1 replication protein [Salmonella enterica]